MSKLSAFLHPVSPQEEKEIIISKRFLDDKGNPVPFKIRALSQEENDKITRQSTKVKKTNGQTNEILDSVEFSRRLVVSATVEPDFSNKELCDAYGVMDPLLVPGKMLLSGEYSNLLNAIMEISGFRDNVEEAAKN